MRLIIKNIENGVTGISGRHDFFFSSCFYTANFTIFLTAKFSRVVLRITLMSRVWNQNGVFSKKGLENNFEILVDYTLWVLKQRLVVRVKVCSRNWHLSIWSNFPNSIQILFGYNLDSIQHSETILSLKRFQTSDFDLVYDTIGIVSNN